MRTVNRSARVPYGSGQMFDLVNDVESYPEFLHWCRGARVESARDGVVEAVLEIGIAGVHKSFRTRNTLTEGESIKIELVSGPFKHLDGWWRFADLPDGGSEVSLELRFEVAASPLAVIFSGLFEELARSQMTAFVARAKERYG